MSRKASSRVRCYIAWNCLGVLFMKSFKYFILCIRGKCDQVFFCYIECRTLTCNTIVHFVALQYLTEALGPLSKEKEQSLSDYNDAKVKRNQEYEELAEKKRNYQQEVEALLKASSKINEYVLLTII